MKYPKTTSIYENCVSPTHPGIEIKVTPDSDAPIMPYATTYHGETLLPIKKVSLFAFLEVIHEIQNNKRV